MNTIKIWPEGYMLCPICRIDLLLSMREGVEIDCCPRCGGIWLDHGELFRLINRMNNETSLKPLQKRKVMKESG